MCGALHTAPESVAAVIKWLPKVVCTITTVHVDVDGLGQSKSESRYRRQNTTAPSPVADFLLRTSTRKPSQKSPVLVDHLLFCTQKPSQKVESNMDFVFTHFHDFIQKMIQNAE